MRAPLIATILLLGPVLSALQPQVAFDVVSVKPAGPQTLPPALWARPFVSAGRVQFRAATARDLVLVAFPAEGAPRPEQRVVGGPPWFLVDRFELNATTDLATAEIQAQLPALLRSVLEDRFRLTWHTEQRRFPVFVLEQVRRGVLGPQLRRSDPSTTPWRSYSTDTASSYGIPLSGVAAGLTASGVTDRQVIDRTGLTGNFDFELYYSRARTIAGRGQPSDDSGPSLFIALQEQLGLKLTPSTESLDVLVVDHIDRPTAN
jgi:uncharacterized protein (TIGR03435 family)